MKDYDRIDKRPWGYFEVLSDKKDHRVKRIVIHPGKRFSLQLHRHRSEHWFIIQGEGKATLSDSEKRLFPYQSVDIPVGTKHRLENTGSEDLVFIEIQTGEYFDEDDIERFHDDFGRV